MGTTDSKLAFKKGVVSLAARQHIAFDDELWSEVITLPEETKDVFELWSSKDIGNLTLTNNNPPPNIQIEPNKNLETLVYVLITRLQSLQHELAPADGQSTINIQILNCMRILTRLMPFVHEAKHLQRWYDGFFWDDRKPTCFMDKETGEPGQFFDGLNISHQYPMEDFETHIGPPLGETLLDIVVRFLFHPGYTIPRRVRPDGTQDLDFVVRVWQTGIGSNNPSGCTKENEKNQSETLRLLLTLMSKPLYIGPNEVVTTEIKPLTFATTRLEKKVIQGILCSLLNTVMKYNPNIFSMSVDFATGADTPKKELVTRSLQFLLVLISYETPDLLYVNEFRKSLSKLHRPADLQFVHQGIKQILDRPVSGSLNYAIGTDKALTWAPETIAFLWEFMECNERFRRYLVDTNGALDYVILVSYYALDAKDDLGKTGVLQMCCYFLQTMSTEPKFAEQLNHTLRHSETFPMIMRIPNFHGSYGDFLICSLHTLFTTTKRPMEFVYPALVEVIRNVAPAQRNLARATSSKLMALYAMLIRSEFLLMNEFNHAMTASMLDAINAVLECNFADNRRFVEVLVANRNRFKALKELTLEGALAEIDRQGQERKDRGDAADIRSPPTQASSFESTRSPLNVRQPSLDGIAEDDSFAIGDDEDGEDADNDQPSRNSSANNAASRAEGTAESKERSLSEKARGKQRVVTTSNSSSSSHNTPTQSLSTLPIARPPSQTPFQPTREWFESWHSKLPLDNILHIIHLAETRQLSFNATPLRTPATPNGPAIKPEAPVTPAAAPDADLPSTPTTLQSRERAGEAPGSAKLPNQSHEGQEASGPDGPSHLKTSRDQARGFQWTPLAIGWYTAFLWSRIYLAEAEAFQGAGGLYSSTNIALFKRGNVGKEISLRSPKGAIDAVGESLAQKISSIGMK